MSITKENYDKNIQKSFFTEKNFSGKNTPDILDKNMITSTDVQEFHYQTSFFLNFYTGLYIELKNYENTINNNITTFTKTIENLNIKIDNTKIYGNSVGNTSNLTTFLTNSSNYEYTFYVKTFESQTTTPNVLYYYNTASVDLTNANADVTTATAALTTANAGVITATAALTTANTNLDTANAAVTTLSASPTATARTLATAIADAAAATTAVTTANTNLATATAAVTKVSNPLYTSGYSTIIDKSKPVFGNYPNILVPSTNINLLITGISGSLTKLSKMPNNNSKFKEILEEVFSQTPENILGYLLYKKIYYNIIIWHF